VVWENNFCQALLDAIVRRRRFKGTFGELVGVPARTLRQLRGPLDTSLPASLLKAEQSNTSIIYGERLILKLLRHVDEGMNPDLEISRFLTERAAFPHSAPLAGALEYRPHRGEARTVAIVHGFAPNQGDAWRYTVDTLGRYCETVLAQPPTIQLAVPLSHVLTLMEEEPPVLARQLIGPYLESVRLLGERTAEMHLALASEPADPLFAPEPFSTLYQRSIYQSMRSLAVQSLQLLRQRLKYLPESVAAEARQVLELEEEIFRRFHNLLHHKLAAMRMRYHGDFHLGQVLYTGKDFVIIDFEGEPARPLSERRMKRSPLRDVAGMLRSFHYAAYAALFDQINKGLLNSHAGGAASLEPWLQFWQIWVSAMFLKAYFARAGHEAFIPRNRTDLQILLEAFVLEKAVYELSYELNTRPDWVRIPLRGIVQLLATKG
jgi:maltose alpha-D-glucosyltransferase/alpha-amylase